jgi:hypothetical protein
MKWCVDLPPMPVLPLLRFYYYSYSWRHIDFTTNHDTNVYKPAIEWAKGPVIATLAESRSMWRYKVVAYDTFAKTRVKDAGWHCSYCLRVKEFVSKLRSYSHTEFSRNPNRMTDEWILHIKRTGLDFALRENEHLVAVNPLREAPPFVIMFSKVFDYMLFPPDHSKLDAQPHEHFSTSRARRCEINQQTTNGLMKRVVRQSSSNDAAIVLNKQTRVTEQDKMFLLLVDISAQRNSLERDRALEWCNSHPGEHNTPTGGYCGDTGSDAKHMTSQVLINMINEHVFQPGTTVIELGGAAGSYRKGFLSLGKVSNYLAFDGAATCEQYSGGTVKYADFTMEQFLGEPADWVISLEVGEHIPETHADQFFRNIARHSKFGAILSWAVKGQNEGAIHVHTENNEYVRKKMETHGFVSDLSIEKILRKPFICKNHCQFHYFGNTIMVFRRREN